MTEKDWIKLCVRIASKDLDNLACVTSTGHKSSANKAKEEARKHATAANKNAEERAARREAALADRAPAIPDATTTIALHAPCECGYEVAACRACNRGWQQLQDERLPAEGDDEDGETGRQSKLKDAHGETMDGLDAMVGFHKTSSLPVND